MCQREHAFARSPRGEPLARLPRSGKCKNRGTKRRSVDHGKFSDLFFWLLHLVRGPSHARTYGAFALASTHFALLAG
jgi:hypothetical protein